MKCPEKTAQSDPLNTLLLVGIFVTLESNNNFASNSAEFQCRFWTSPLLDLELFPLQDLEPFTLQFHLSYSSSSSPWSVVTCCYPKTLSFSESPYIMLGIWRSPPLPSPPLPRPRTVTQRITEDASELSPRHPRGETQPIRSSWCSIGRTGVVGG